MQDFILFQFELIWKKKIFKSIKQIFEILQKV